MKRGALLPTDEAGGFWGIEASSHPHSTRRGRLGSEQGRGLGIVAVGLNRRCWATEAAVGQQRCARPKGGDNRCCLVGALRRELEEFSG
jgi:hypothetical protein